MIFGTPYIIIMSVATALLLIWAIGAMIACDENK